MTADSGLLSETVFMRDPIMTGCDPVICDWTTLVVACENGSEIAQVVAVISLRASVVSLGFLLL